MNWSIFRTLSLCVVGVWLTPQAQAIDIVFDYSYDTQGFFTSHPAAKMDLETAAQAYEMKLGDTLSAITPSGGNTWSASFTNPSTLQTASVSGLSIAQNAILVFVGGADLGNSGELGQGGPGGYSGSGSTNWLNTIKARGQSGALASTPTDFGPWGGSISFNSTASWHFSDTTLTSSTSDFLSVAIHELGHLLGIGTAASWSNKINGSGNFTGSNSVTAYNGAVPTDAGGGHWAEGTMSKIYGTNTTQEVAMDPTLLMGTQKLLTTLDVAGLKDVGWLVANPVPEPAALGLVLGVLGMLGLTRRR